MALSRSNIKSAVINGIGELVVEFQRQPYAFLYESDIQSTLYAKLRSCLSEPVHVAGQGNPENRYETNVVHTEYWKHLDIVCLDTESKQWSNIRVHQGGDVHIYELPILVGIELKYCKMGDRFGVSSCIKDFEKLKELGIQLPISIGFLQHSSYEDSFFNGISTQYNWTKVSKVDPFEMIHVISPKNLWRVSQVGRVSEA